MLDLFDRKIVSYKFGDVNDTELALSTLITAKEKAKEFEKLKLKKIKLN